MNPVFYVPANPDTASINAAINSFLGPGIVRLPAAVYDTAPGKIIMRPGVHLIGSGAGSTIIPITSLLQDYLIDGHDCPGCRVSNLTLDMGNFLPVDTDAGSGAVFVTGDGAAVEDIEVANMGRYGIISKGGSRRLSIRRCRVTNNNPTGMSTNIAIMVHAPGSFWDIRAIDNEVFGSPMTFYMSRGIVARNQVANSQFGNGIGFDDGPYCSGNLILDNRAMGGSGTDVHGTTVQGFEIWGDHQKAHRNHAEANAGTGFSFCGAGGHSAIGNTTLGNAGGSHAELGGGVPGMFYAANDWR